MKPLLVVFIVVLMMFGISYLTLDFSTVTETFSNSVDVPFIPSDEPQKLYLFESQDPHLLLRAARNGGDCS